MATLSNVDMWTGVPVYLLWLISLLLGYYETNKITQISIYEVENNKIDIYSIPVIAEAYKKAYKGQVLVEITYLLMDHLVGPLQV